METAEHETEFDQAEEELSGEEAADSNDETNEEQKSKKKKPGIVYLSSIPSGMNPSLVREFLGVYGEIGKSFLQPRDRPGKKKKKWETHFEEGWVEFKSKRGAKMVAARLNNNKVGGKRTSKYYDCLWNIKYLPGFKWAHLSERLAYEKAVFQQRMRAEISQVKRESNFFVESVDKSKKVQRKMATLNGWNVIQRQTEDEILERKEGDNNDRTEFLKNLFRPPAS